MTKLKRYLYFPAKRTVTALLAVMILGAGLLIWQALPDDTPEIPVQPAVTCGTGETVDPISGECIPPPVVTVPPTVVTAAPVEAEPDTAQVGQKPRCAKCLVPCLVGSHHDCNSCNDHECSDSVDGIHWPGCVSEPFCWPPELLDAESSYPDWPWCKLTGDCVDADVEGQSDYAKCLHACLDTLHCGSYQKNRRACGEACQRDPHQNRHPWGYYCDSSTGACDAAEAEPATP